ncbi:hypothetical protein BST63_00440 [Bradyrhizobium canariense]|uniref:Uncharacterized protein n=2 Tax=Bradyrhizobium canariense TaxID=255045 RepID=A0ABX3XCS3_9BRAD|nr:hypothetical protein BSR47_00330 [Bradyrhizobium canariense]OSJ36650.1 hypothetical protein BST63_00440 [Bradyrhizobium canariense]
MSLNPRSTTSFSDKNRLPFLEKKLPLTKQKFAISEVAYVGDSLSKDVLMAKRADCFAVWAKYGAHTDRSMYDRLIRISHWTADDIRREKNYATEAKGIEPDFICERSIAELLELA